MCAIAGIIDFRARPAAHWSALASRLSDSLRHRGPDGAGRVDIHDVDASPAVPRPVSPAPATVIFLHRRLAIIDLSDRARQPMRDSAGTTCLTYNGEIYNYQDLLRELRRRGIALRSSGDTAAVAEWLAVEGHDALARFRGMFALASWNSATACLTLARDRYGMKPLVYIRPEPGVLVFSSEPDALLSSCGMARAANAHRLSEFLTWGSIAPDGSFWSGLETVAPGEYVEYDGNTPRSHTYWSLDKHLLRTARTQPLDEAARHVERAVVDAVSSHLTADVPVGIMLSGGLDSATILAVASQVSHDPLHSFTLSFGDQDLDEGPTAASLAHHFGTIHHAIRLDDNRLDTLVNDFIESTQTPTPGGLNTYIVTEAVREHGIKVVLSGLGGDELFGGYRSFVRVPQLAAATPHERAVLLSRAGADSPLARCHRHLRERRATSVAQIWWTLRRFLDRDDVVGFHPEAPEPEIPLDPVGVDPFSIVRWFETRRFLQSQLLPDCDTFSMRHGVEVRAPLVDHQLVESVMEVGVWPRHAGMTFKSSLFGAFPSLRLPPFVPQIKKGFVLPFKRWLRTALISPSPPYLQDFGERLRHPRYARLVARFLADDLHWSSLWGLYVLERTSGWPSARATRIS